jgi:hypothetical protein
MNLRESRVREICMHGLSGGRWPALGNPMRHLRPDTYEPFEQRRNIAGGEWGGKAADQGERWSTPHAPDTERETWVPAAVRREFSECVAGLAIARGH